MDRETLIDMALLKRQAVRDYVRRRHALRAAVRLGLPAEIVRATRHQVINHKATWSLLRAELRGI